MTSKNIFQDEWDASYQRGDNAIFYPKEEIVKFLNRFVRKKTGFNEFVDIFDFSKEIRGLDYGCGMGRAKLIRRTHILHGFRVQHYWWNVNCPDARNRASWVRVLYGQRRLCDLLCYEWFSANAECWCYFSATC